MNPYIITGLAVLAFLGLISLIAWLVKREIQRQATRFEAMIEEARPKICLNSEFVCRIQHATTAKELSGLDVEILHRRDELFGDDVANLQQRIETRLRDLGGL